MNNTGIRITAITLLYSIFDDQSHLVVRRTVLVPVDIAPWCSGHYRVIIPDLPAMVKEWISNGKETDFLKEYLHLHTCDYTSQIVASWGRRLE
jgi:hypothetical protein